MNTQKKSLGWLRAIKSWLVSLFKRKPETEIPSDNWISPRDDRRRNEFLRELNHEMKIQENLFNNRFNKF